MRARWKRGMSMRRYAVTLLALLALGARCAGADCNKTVECCSPGKAQDGDAPGVSDPDGSFCTHKPFEEDFTMKIGLKIPMEIQLVDYCTDQVIYTAYAAPRMDYFTAITVPCTYQPAPCSDFPVDEQEKCEEHKKLFDKKCSETSGFWSKYASKHICSQENYNAGNLVQPDGGRMRWTPPVTFSGDSAESLVGGCNCDYSVQTRNGTVAATKGVPDNFIKEGMSTFYVQVVIGGRKTYAEDDAECQCTGPQDTSDACMCALGTRKVPYVYNNAFVPYLTALVSVKSGRLVYTNTYVRYNFEENGIGCVACSREYCWGSPQKNLKGWIQASPQFLKVADPKICAIPRVPVSGEAVPFCRYPASDRDIDMCSLKVYVAWVGTDGFGQGCDSHNKMFSRFTQMGVSNVAVQFYDGISSLVFNVEARITGRDGAVIT